MRKDGAEGEGWEKKEGKKRRGREGNTIETKTAKRIKRTNIRPNHPKDEST